jgi:hypothetical protein
MVVCANCTNEALYTYQINEEIKQNYCDDCLPKFLLSRRDAGQIPLQTPVVEETVVKSSKKKVTEDSTTDTVVDSVTE